MIEKRRCPNCGAYLKESDTECYVCGEPIAEVPNVKPRETKPNSKTYAPVVFEPEENEDFVTPVDYDESNGKPFEERVPYSDGEMVTGNETQGEENEDDSYNSEYNDKYKGFTDFDPYEDYDDGEKKKGSKKALIICAVLAAAAGIAAIVVALMFNNAGGGDDSDKMTIYFDKPSVNLILRDENGKGYNWGADVKVCYAYENREDNIDCSTFEEYDDMWQCQIPKEAESVYFYQKSGGELRTDTISEVEDGNVYFVTDITINSKGCLPMAYCPLSDFDNKKGVNAVQSVTEKPTKETKETKATKATKATESKTEETTKATEPSTVPVNKSYTVKYPSSWKKGAKKIIKDNCATYYEKYNYAEYGMGMLLSVYVFEKGDTSYGDLNVKKVLDGSDGRKIVIVTPTDVQFDDSDEVAAEKYIALETLTDEVIASIKAK
ncbi:MAG: zinc ribbon domain-containing protein [Ruminococcus sp.]|nr:zinc ribbon domain-containing protein [Ruminococcus sp.]